MSDVVSYPEICSQQVELLPARILLQTGTLGNVLGNLGGHGGSAVTVGDAVSGPGSGPAADGNVLGVLGGG
ncbi:MAG: hypothetical protein ACRDTC_01790 [Pseudonocardiaceae bacterium]